MRSRTVGGDRLSVRPSTLIPSGPGLCRHALYPGPLIDGRDWPQISLTNGESPSRSWEGATLARERKGSVVIGRENPEEDLFPKSHNNHRSHVDIVYHARQYCEYTVSYHR